MAEVHLIGEVEGAHGVGSGFTSNILRVGGGQGLWCKWEIQVEDNGRWNKIEGAKGLDAKPLCVDKDDKPVLNEYGTTQVCFCKPGGEAVWQHPIDVHYATTALRGWPRMIFEVWSQNKDGRNEFAGYGVHHLPNASGVYDLEVPLWRPASSSQKERWTSAGIFSAIKGVFLGIWPRLDGDINRNGYCEPSAAKALVTNAKEVR